MLIQLFRQMRITDDVNAPVSVDKNLEKNHCFSKVT